MNRELLARVRDRIAEVGNDHCDMKRLATGTIRADGEPDCGTAGCIAGWALALHFGFQTENNTRDAFDASRVLGFSLREGSNLFFTRGWPEHYYRLAESEGDAKGMLSILDAILDGRVVFGDYGELIDLEAELADEIEERSS